jgi:hypothetical protein
LDSNVDINIVNKNNYYGTPDVPQNPQQPKISIDTLVKTTRGNIRDRIIEKYGKMKVLDMTRPMGLGQIYVQKATRPLSTFRTTFSFPGSLYL